MYFLVVPFTCITVQSYPSFDLVQSPQVLFHLVFPDITVQSYPSFDLVQSPQVLFHLHVFPGHMYYSSVLS